MDLSEDGGAPRFFDAGGRLLEAAPDRVTSLPHWDGTPADIGAAVSVLWRRVERAAQRVGEHDQRGCCPVSEQPSTAGVDW